MGWSGRKMSRSPAPSSSREPPSPPAPTIAPVHELERTVRFCISPSLDPADEAALPRHNTYAGWPPMVGLGAFYALSVRCAGRPDARRGYVADIGAIDRAVREVAVPRIGWALRAASTTDPAALLRGMLPDIESAVGARVASIAWHLSPFHSVTVEAAAMDRILLSQRFEFAAAHRLHRADCSDQENRAMYGRCNNPHGHGHNYALEVRMRVPAGADGAPARPGHGDLARIVDEQVLRRFDHANLNLDIEEFADTVPTVEHIASACFNRLRDPIADAGGELAEVTVWETEKTCVTVRRD